MNANPKKFQATYLGNKAHDNINSFQTDNVNTKCEDSVTLLGFSIDFLLNFDSHVSEMCKKSLQKYNATVCMLSV